MQSQTSAGGFPDPEQVLAGSAWIAGMPGLPEAALAWREELLPLRDDMHRRADKLARPRPDPALALRAAEVGMQLANAGRRMAARRVRGELDSVKVARDLRRAFEALGPTYIKLGQLISSSVGLVPADVADEFGKCRDAIKADPFSVVETTVDRAFGDSGAVFSSFDPEPIASASIAQVHAATLRDGREVVVKVRHPGTRRRFYQDIAIMAWQATLLDRLRSLGIVNPRALVELLARQIVEELDLRLEALNMCEIGASIEHAGLDYVRCPRPVPELVSERVLVMERLDGIPYADVAAIVDSGVDTERLLALGIRAVLDGTFVYGIFHGDLHAGNLLVQPPDSFGLLDYGIVGRLSETQRLALVRFAFAVASGDVRGQIEAMAAFEAFPPDAPLDGMIADLETHQAHVQRELVASAEEFGLDDLADAIAVVIEELSKHGFRMPPELALFCKNLLYLNSSILTLAPHMDLIEVLGPIMFSLATKHAELFAGQIRIDASTARERAEVGRDIGGRLRSGRLGSQVEKRL